MAPSGPHPAPKRPIGILGAGRQAIETDGYCREGGYSPSFFVEEEAPGYGRDDSAFRAPILTSRGDLEIRRSTPVVSAVGYPDVRRRLVELWPGDDFVSIVSLRAWVASDVVIGRGSTVAPNAALNRFVRVGDHVLVNVGAILSHDVAVADFATVSPGCAIGGGVTIGADAFIGIGAVVRNHVTIGRGAVVAAGAVVVNDVDDGMTVLGLPARPAP